MNFDTDIKIGGVWCQCIDTTESVIAQRQLKTLVDIPSQNKDVTSHEDFCRECVRKLQHNTQDIPFAVLYSVENNNSILR